MPKHTVDELPYAYSEAAIKAARLQAIADNGSSYDDSVSADSAMGEVFEYSESPLEAYTDAKKDVSSTRSAGVYCADIKIVMTGDPDKEQALLDEVMYMPSVRLTGFAWDDMAPVAVTDEEGVTEIVETNDKQLTVMLNLYMYDSGSAGMALSDDDD